MSAENLFSEETGNAAAPPPLAARMRPRTLEEFAGQEEVLGPGTLLRQAITNDRVTSLVIFGPPGTGKTSLASIIACHTKGSFVRINAVTSNVHDIRRIILAAREQKNSLGRKTILFVDEIHRFNKAQQDAFMEDVEEGNLVLVGATTRNPFFALSPPLLSRSLVAQFKPLREEDIGRILKRALKDGENGLGGENVRITGEALSRLVRSADHDARRALTALEIAVSSAVPDSRGVIRVTLPVAEKVTRGPALRYDRDEDEHYDHISAFIKSVRGSDPQAAIYYLARMLEAGEDPRFIARRLVILASEDIGNAEPQALPLAVAAMQAAEMIGMPEARIILAQATTFLACAPKSNAAYLAVEKASSDIKHGRVLPVPDHLREAGYPGAERLGRGRNYRYPHDYHGHYAVQEYLAEPREYYHPTGEGREKEMRERLARLKEFEVIFREKKKLRKEMLARRSALSPEKVKAAGERIRKCLALDPEFKKAETIAVYASIRKEVETGNLIKQAIEQGKTVCLPRLAPPPGKKMSFHRVANPEKDLETGKMGIPEPRQDLPPVEPPEMELVVVPGVAFDESGARLGLGGGYYDAFLARLPAGIPIIALAYEFQVRRSPLPALPKDIKTGKIITEERIIEVAV